MLQSAQNGVRRGASNEEHAEKIRRARYLAKREGAGQLGENQRPELSAASGDRQN